MSRATFAALAPVLLVLGFPLALLAGAGAMLVDLSDRVAEDVAHIVFGNAGPIARSVAAGALACGATAVLGVGPAWLLSRASQMRFGAYAPTLSVLLPAAVVPLLVGVGSFAFVYRDLGGWWLVINGPDARGIAAVVAAEVLAQAIRYAPLLFWLLVIVAGDVESARRSYARQLDITGGQWTRIELAGRWTPVVLVVLAFVYQDAANDVLITQLALRPSVATGSEMAGHALERELAFLLVARSAPQAIGAIIVGAAAIATFLALGFLVIALAVLAILRRAASLPLPSAVGGGLPDRAAAPSLGLVVPTVALITVAMLAAKLRPTGTADALGALVPTMAAAAVAAIGSWALAAFCAYRLRDRTRAHRAETARDFRLASGLAVTVGFIPPLGLAAAVFGIGYALNPDGNDAGWVWMIVAELIRFTPVIFVLLVPAACAVHDEKIDYLRSIGAPFWERCMIAFLRPSATMHGAVLLIAFNLILNEGVIAAMFQAEIPSLADVMRQAITGRSANYELAGLLIGLQFILFSSLLLVWGRTVLLRWRSDRDAT